MSDHKSPTRFSLDLPGFELEITGDRAFVEELYHRVSQDVLPLVFHDHTDEQATVVKASPTGEPAAGYTWVYGVTQYYNKVYAVSDEELRTGVLGPFVVPSRLRRIYVDRDDSDLFTSLAGSQKTLWAEFTPEGRDRFQS